jgi:hypothetical protein
MKKMSEQDMRYEIQRLNRVLEQAQIEKKEAVRDSAESRALARELEYLRKLVRDLTVDKPHIVCDECQEKSRIHYGNFNP